MKLQPHALVAAQHRIGLLKRARVDRVDDAPLQQLITALYRSKALFVACKRVGAPLPPAPWGYTGVLGVYEEMTEEGTDVCGAAAPRGIKPRSGLTTVSPMFACLARDTTVEASPPCIQACCNGFCPPILTPASSGKGGRVKSSGMASRLLRISSSPVGP